MDKFKTSGDVDELIFLICCLAMRMNITVMSAGKTWKLFDDWTEDGIIGYNGKSDVWSGLMPDQSEYSLDLS